ncbi:hypothetical protein LWC33_08825 [Pseudonocardia sp. RS11V-5]|uniref:hypothetical protein n=1 Tax=Pseudonocardia terrae TaxID=2905831 RepID=UPI001E29430B|nr:hypothetical protein [Pseudonocardia terrae]MCE3551556.1 hypothetical protein [Pseudonocardia terrae]
MRGRTRGDLLVVVAYGLALGGMNICFYQAIARIPLGAAVTLEVLGPLALSVLAGRGLLSVVWAVLALAGVALLGESAGALVLEQELTPLGALAIALVVVACAGAVRWGGSRSAPVQA